MNTFEFQRFRFHFRAKDAVRFPAGKSANVIRGAFGMLLRESASSADYARLFEPRSPAAGPGPSGLADEPRPFVFRASHLDGQAIAPEQEFFFDVHYFDVARPALRLFREALKAVADQGIGPGRGHATLEQAGQLDLDNCERAVSDDALPPCMISLDARLESADRVRIQFLTPTELKSGGAVVKQPEFAILFGRLRDRLSTLRALYGAGPLDIDFRGTGDRAAAVRVLRADLRWERVGRKSSRTGQAHSIGGFTGEVEYEGSVGEFLPWLRAARWVGVGRQTVWGKGEIRVVGVGP